MHKNIPKSKASMTMDLQPLNTQIKTHVGRRLTFLTAE